MTSLPDRGVSSSSSDPLCEGNIAPCSSSSEQKEDCSLKQSKTSILSCVFNSPFNIFEAHQDSSANKSPKSSSGSYDWSRVLRRIVCSGSMWRFLGTSKVLTSSDVWFLGKCYKLSSEESSSDSDSESGHATFLEDFSSRIWITYRRGFDAISDSKYTSDVNWGCMVRSSQMLVAQALIFHHLGRSWRRPLEKPYNPEYIGILHMFGDSEACAFSIHNLLQAGNSYGLAAGSWVGPYAMCRAWQTLVRTNREQHEVVDGNESFPMALYVVSGDEDGERGGAPVVCIDVAAQLCCDFNKGQSTWSPILLLVPLVLGLDKINPRYIPLLKETFTFPQSLGILGGKPGTSTYIAGVQDDRALYLDPHEVQMAVDIAADNIEADTSSYHCSTVRDLALDLIDPSLAIGFYCRDKDDFDDFCSRATELVDKANGAPLFTVVQSVQPSKQMYNQDDVLGISGDGNINVEDLDASGTDAGGVGVTYGMRGTTMPPPADVARFLSRDTIFDRVRLLDADPRALRAFAGTGLAVDVTVPNADVPRLAASRASARRWVRASVAPYAEATNVSRVLVGDEVISQANRTLLLSLVPAHAETCTRRWPPCCRRRRRRREIIKVSTPHSLGILAASTPPSAGRFHDGYDTAVVKPLLGFLRATGAPFMVNAYPFYGGLTNDTLDYVLFRVNDGVTDNATGLLYANMLDAQLDAVQSAMRRLRSGPGADLARDYNKDAIRHFGSGVGTPLMPNRTFELSIFSLFDENLKPGPVSERNFGLYHADMTPVYDAGILTAPQEIVGTKVTPAPAPALAPAEDGRRRWCVPKPAADEVALQVNIDFVCGQGGIDCGAIRAGGSCYDPNNVQAHAAFAMNLYFQSNGQHEFDCDFGQTGVITTVDPSYKSCKFT
ncbi:hypothetical protein OsJ_16662 [Oryza sativa Japonica Group]|uniref:Cysteine protease n=2 Tax=Oryza sativa subsp. japonica TaxID=39947 RepID=B9FDC5_ORYSJ|nr:hypothetical protein OsJ_16662 [Oryza sativa Japonica Group]